MKQYKRSFRFVCKENERSTLEELLKMQGFDWEREEFFSYSCLVTE